MKTKTLTFALLAALATFAGTAARADTAAAGVNEPNRAEHRDRRDDRRDDRDRRDGRDFRDHRDDDRDFRHGPNYGPRRVVVVPGPRHVPAAGYWRETLVKTWVPGRWIMSHDYRGRPVNTFIAGHYDTRVERTWVPTGHHR